MEEKIIKKKEAECEKISVAAFLIKARDFAFRDLHHLQSGRHSINH